MLELLDSIWVNEVYKPHMYTLVEVTKKEALRIHTIESFDELATRKIVFKKILNLVH